MSFSRAARTLPLPFLVFIAIADAVCIAQTLTTKEPSIVPRLDSQTRIKHTLELLGDNKFDRGFRELSILKKMVGDDVELVKQLAYYTEHMTGGDPGVELGKVRFLLDHLEVSDAVVIRALAPFLEADDEELRSLVRDWFQYHDNGGHGLDLPPLHAVNFKEYKNYVSARLNRNESVPAAFVRYIYGRHPGHALLVFVHAHDDAQDAREGPEPIPPSRQTKELLWAEHVVSDALWQKQHGFIEKDAAPPEAVAELEKLSKHERWWARLYAAEILLRHPELGTPQTVERLKKDEHELVRAAITRKQRKKGVERPTAPPQPDPSAVVD